MANWLSDGYLERRFPPGATEEEYELSTATVEAIRFLSAIPAPHSTVTESRLSLVIQALAGLAGYRCRQASPDRAPDGRAGPHRQGDRCPPQGSTAVLPRDTALERTWQIISLADDLTGDFRRVRDQFEPLNRELRERIFITARVRPIASQFERSAPIHWRSS